MIIATGCKCKQNIEMILVLFKVVYEINFIKTVSFTKQSFQSISFVSFFNFFFEIKKPAFTLIPDFSCKLIEYDVKASVSDLSPLINMFSKAL